MNTKMFRPFLHPENAENFPDLPEIPEFRKDQD
jgi:hypothetical protein